MSQLGPDPAPPTSSEFDIAAEVPKWPKVVGIISIVLSSLSLVCGGCGVGMLVFMRSLMKMAEAQMGPAPAVLFPGPVIVALGVVGVLWALVLLGAGIATLRRRANGRTLHVVYASLAVVLAIVSTCFNVQYQNAIHAWVAANPSDKWAQQQSPVGGYIGMAFGVCLGIGYPIFLLIWFGGMKKRPEAGAPNQEPLV